MQIALSLNHAHKLRHLMGGKEALNILENPEIEDDAVAERIRKESHPHKLHHRLLKKLKSHPLNR